MNIALVVGIWIHLVVLDQNPVKIDSLKSVLSANPSSDKTAAVYHQLALEYQAIDYTLSSSYADKAIALYEQLENHEKQIDLIDLKAWGAKEKGLWRESLSLFQEEADLSEEFSYLKGKSEGYNGMGIIYYYQGKYHMALEQYFKSLETRKEMGEDQLVAKSYNNIGGIYYQQDNIRNAISYYLKSIEIKESNIDKQGLTASYSNVGLLYKSLGQFEEAIEYYQKALKMREELGMRSSIDDSYNVIGSAHQANGDFETALQYYNKSRQINEEIDDPLGLSGSLEYIGQLHLDRKEYDRALDSFRESLLLSQKHGSDVDIAYRLMYLGNTYFLSGKPNEARGYLIQAVSLSKDFGSTEITRDAAEILANTEEQLGNYKEAFMAYRLHMSMSDSLKNDELTQRLARVRAEYNFKQQKDSIEFAGVQEKLALDQIMKDQRNTNIFLVIGLVILLIVIFILFRYYRMKFRSSKILLVKNEMIQKQNEQILQQKDSLEETLYELRQTQKQLIQSEKMASVGVLAAGIGHEINNPLNYIKGGMDFLSKNQDDGTNSEDYETYLKLIDEGIERISTIVRNLGQFSRNDTALKEECDLEEIMENCLTILNEKFSDRITITRNYTADSHMVFGNFSSLYRVFLNLLTNAEQAIESVGEITISTFREVESLTVKISDTGYGIPKKDLERVTDLFYTTKHVGVAKGLGLSIAYSIVKDHGGYLDVESTRGKGTTAIVRLPIKQNL